MYQQVQGAVQELTMQFGCSNRQKKGRVSFGKTTEGVCANLSTMDNTLKIQVHGQML